MKKLLLILTVFALVASLMPTAAAQDDALPLCSEDELTAVAEALEAYNEGIASLDEISTDANDAVYGAVVVGYDAFSYAFWAEVFPEFPACVEAQVLGITFGLAYDQLTIAAAYANIAGWAIAMGDAEGAELFANAATERVEEINAQMETLAELDVADFASALPNCTKEEYMTNTAALEAFGDAVDEAMADLDLGTDDVTNAVVTLAAIDLIASEYWDTIYPELPACAEAEYDALLVGLTLDELVLISSLGANALLEDAAGNTEIAQALADSMNVRMEDLTATMEEMNME